MANDYDAEIAALEKVLELASQFRALKVCVAGIEVTLAPRPEEASSVEAGDVTLPTSSEARCRCGHEFHEHTEAGCLHGCRLALCAPEE